MDSDRYSRIEGVERMDNDDQKYWIRMMQRIVNNNHSIDNVRINVGIKSRFVDGSGQRSSSISADRALTKNLVKDRVGLASSDQYIEELKAYLCSYPEMGMDVVLQNTEPYALDPKKVEEASLALSTLDLNSLSSDQIYHYSTVDKYTSSAFQALLSTLPIPPTLFPTLPRLITHKYGNYIVQMLMHRSTDCVDVVRGICIEYFEVMCSDEGGSRIMQLLVEINTTFRLYSLSRIRTSLHKYMRHISSVLLIAATFRVSRSEELDFFTYEFLKCPLLWISSKAYKRVLTSAIQVGTHSFLNNVFYALALSTRLEAFLQEKYCTTILITMVERGHTAVITAICHRLYTNCLSLCRTRYFRPLVEQLSREPIFRTRLIPVLKHCTQYRYRITKKGDLWHLYLSYLLAFVERADRSIPVERAGQLPHHH